MSKLYFKAESREQINAILGLAYHVADVNYIKERYGVTDPEFSRADKNVLLAFETLDKLKVPFWVQNSVICFAENWLLKNRNIDLYLN